MRACSFGSGSSFPGVGNPAQKVSLYQLISSGIAITMTDLKARQPKGELVMRTIPMPADTNPNGDIFGGWVVSHMDLGGSALARRTARCRVTTVAVDAMSFIYPVNIGDLVSCYARLESIGNTSMKIHIEVWVERLGQDAICATEGCFTYVAIDENGRPVPVRTEKSEIA